MTAGEARRRAWRRLLGLDVPRVTIRRHRRGWRPLAVEIDRLEDRTLLSAVTFSSTDVPLLIPDRVQVASTLDVDQPIVIGDVNVILNISHTFDAELNVFLISPAGTRVELFTGVGGSGDSFHNTVLDDDAAISIPFAAAPFTGSFRPEGNLNSLTGRSALGQWRLEIFDSFFFGRGTLHSWSLAIEPPPPPGEISGTKFADLDGDGARGPGEPGLADWTIFLDANGNGALDTETRTFSRSDLAAELPAQSTIQSQIFVAGLTGSILDLDVTLDLSHSFASDVDAFLISPQGRRLELFTGVGDSRDDFKNTIFDDEAPLALTDFGPPFAGRFRPEGRLSDFDGRSPNGVWTLELTDRLPDDAGVLKGWSLNFTASTETSTLTDADGNYRLVAPAGSHAVGEVQQPGYVATLPGPASGGLYHVVVGPGEVLGGLDFGNRPFPDLAGVRFEVFPSSAQWGAAVLVEYAVTNRGGRDAGPFAIDLRLSADDVIDGADVPLQTVAIPGLAAGETLVQSRVVTLPGTAGAPPPGFGTIDDVLLGLSIDSTDAIAEAEETNNSNVGEEIDSDRLGLRNHLEGAEPNDTPPTATEIGLASPQVLGAIDFIGDVDLYRIEVTERGLLAIDVRTADGGSLDARAALITPDSFVFFEDRPVGGSTLLASSDDRSPDDRDPFLRAYLLPGVYDVRVEPGGDEQSTGPYRLVTSFAPADDPVREEELVGTRVGSGPVALVSDDFNRDGVLDLATLNAGSANVSVLLGVGEGTFEPQRQFPVPDRHDRLEVLDFNADGRLDLVTLDARFDASFNQVGDIAVLPGTGDGGFRGDQLIILTPGDAGYSAVAAVFAGPQPQQVFADFNRDGFEDFVFVNAATNSVSVFAGVPLDVPAELRLPTIELPTFT
ncbi:MAG: proprotein convertase P-domain-containing protein, partial [Planctomycetes bacterium]|nr:proprotein convertase P-domain-containing protein [Planctomycetota bacterium]